MNTANNRKFNNKPSKRTVRHWSDLLPRNCHPKSRVGMTVEQFVRQCAHNFAERTAVQAELDDNPSKPRAAYLSNQMRKLLNEKNFFESIKVEFFIRPEHNFVL